MDETGIDLVARASRLDLPFVDLREFPLGEL